MKEASAISAGTFPAAEIFCGETMSPARSQKMAGPMDKPGERGSKAESRPDSAAIGPGPAAIGRDRP
jgi:hypothetical protein